MAAKQTITIVLATIFALTLCRAKAQAPVTAPEASGVVFGPSAAEPVPTPNCMTNLLNLSDCLSYVEAGSTMAKPGKACCPELAGLVESSPECLCLLLDENATSSYGINIDMKRALGLPNVCGVSTPPVSLCSAINESPAPTGGEGNISPGLAPEGLAATSSNENTTSGASNIAISALALLAALPIASLPIFFGI